jgi:branched-chain amino acid transport system ATP-binding protein
MGLARTFQQPVAADTLTVLENAYLAASFRRGRTGRRSRTDDVAAGEAALKLVGLEHRATMAASQLPVYDKKRLMIATALATEPLVLLLDEPFGGLNPREIDDTLALLRRVRETGVAIVCIEHVMRALVALADRVLVMHHGAELFVGTPAEMMRDQRVIDVYLGASGSGAE